MSSSQFSQSVCINELVRLGLVNCVGHEPVLFVTDEAGSVVTIEDFVQVIQGGMSSSALNASVNWSIMA